MYRRFGQTKNEFANFSNKIEELSQTYNWKMRSVQSMQGIPMHTYRIGGAVTQMIILEQHYKNGFNSHGLKQLVNQPTHITETSISCIDLIVTDQPNLFLECHILLG